MAQADYTIDNASGATVRADINATLAAIVTQNSGASAPATTFAHMLWADTTNGVLKRRNAANSGWVVLAPLASTMVQAKSANYTVLLSDYGTLIDCTNTITIALTAAATLGDGFWFDVRNSGTGTVTIDPDGSETIDGAATITLEPGDSCRVHCNGATFKTIGSNAGYWRGQSGSAEKPSISFGADSDTGMFLAATDIIGWATAGAERMRLNSNGILFLNATTTVVTGVGGAVLQVGGPGAFNRADNGTLIAFGRGGTLVGTISVSESATSYNTSSDARLKQAIEDAPYDPDWIEALTVRRFEFKSSPGVKHVGFIAQELATIAPEAVTPGDDDQEKGPGDPGFVAAGVDYSKLVPRLIQELQQLRARVKVLESK